MRAVEQSLRHYFDALGAECARTTYLSRGWLEKLNKIQKPRRRRKMRDSSLAKVIGDEECIKIVRKKLGDHSIDNFRLVDYEIIPIGEINGFMGQYFTLRIIICRDNDEPSENRVYNFFAKTPPPTSSPQYDWTKLYGTFEKEVNLYKTVFPEICHNIETNRIPELLFSEDKNAIVLEDMTESGYIMADKSISFDLEHCRVVLRTLAKFHANSIVFEEVKKKNLHDEFGEWTSEALWPSSEGKSKRMFDAAVKGVDSLIDLVEQLTSTERQRFKKFFRACTLNHVEKLSRSNEHRNVLCHGDLWANNILFRYDANGKPEDCCFVDFQLARYNPPAHDILCFLQFTTTRQFRRNNREYLYKIYWDSMAECLSDAGLEPALLLPWIKFVDSLKELQITSMIHGILNIPIMLLEPTAAKKYFSEEPDLLESILFVDRSPFVCQQFNQVPQYRERILDALLELYESALR